LSKLSISLKTEAGKTPGSRPAPVRRVFVHCALGEKAMACTITRINYYYTTVRDQPGEAYKLLTILGGLGINQLAFSAVPVGPNVTQLTIFPEDQDQLLQQAKSAGLPLEGPHPVFLVQGDDELGTLADIHRRLFEANINVYASNGVTDGRGSFGYLIYVKEGDFERAADALGI